MAPPLPDRDVRLPQEPDGETDPAAWYRAVFEHAQGYLGLVALDGRVLSANPASLAFGGLDASQVLGRPIWETPWVDYDPAQQAHVRAAIESALAGVPSQVELLDRSADGSLREVEFSASPVRDDEGRIRFLVVEGRDVAASRQAQREQRELREQLLHAQKMESLGRLAGGVAHDFNNLLTTILGNAELVRAALPPGELADALEDVLQASRSGAGLARQLLAFSRKQPADPRPLDLGREVGRIATLLRRLMGEDVDLQVEASPAAPVSMDPGQLEQILANLAVNARDAMPSGGRVRIEVRDAPGGDEDGEVELSFSDTGAGMGPEVARRAFEPFFTTKPAGQGTGLGLALVYGAVAQHGGRIAVRSAPGAGTRFELRFPAARAPVEAAPAPVAARPVTGGAERVLLVEDEPLVRASLVRSLGAMGYRLTACSGPEAALEALAGEAPFDLLLTDVRMPGQSGLELAATARRRRPGLRVLFVSGDPGPAGGRASELGPLLQKPFTRAALAEAVREALARPAP